MQLCTLSVIATLSLRPVHSIILALRPLPSSIRSVNTVKVKYLAAECALRSKYSWAGLISQSIELVTAVVDPILVHMIASRMSEIMG